MIDSKEYVPQKLRKVFRCFWGTYSFCFFTEEKLLIFSEIWFILEKIFCLDQILFSVRECI